MMKLKKYLLILTIGLMLLTPVFGSLPASAQAGTKPETIVFISEPNFENAITMLEDGNLDIYPAYITDSELLERVEASPELDYYKTYGTYNELTFNPAGPVFNNGKLNPFTVPVIREAMNYLIDRDYIAAEIMGGLGTPRWTALNTVSLDAASLASELRAIELQYAYNQQLAKQIIDGEMLALGAVLIGGVWHYNGEPVEIIVLIRIEDERLAIGDYVADQLESIGFQVFRDYKSSADASPIWLWGDPNDGLFHIYTGGWITTEIPRDLAGNFAYFYTDMGRPEPLWQAYVNTPEFYDLASRLNYTDYSTFQEWWAMMTRALELSMEDSVRIFLCDRNAFIPKQIDLSLASDLYGGMQSNLWAKTIHRTTGENGEVIIAVPSLFIDPWNPIAGVNWLNDRIPVRATADFGVVNDPFTGLMLPDRIESAEVVIEQGHPVQKTLDWVDLAFEDEIIVPGDAWGAWDAKAQRFIEVSELSPGETVIARSKSTVFYPEDLFDVVKWHDGSTFSIADILMHMILTFDRAQEKSPIYDESAVWAYERFMSNFKGVKIISEQPLIIETYSDLITRDAENNVTTWWPYYEQGQGAWHALNLGIRAEVAGEGAFSGSKAFEGVTWLDYVTDSVGILNDQLAAWGLDRTIPYAPTLDDYIDQAELEGRLVNLQNWYGEHGHFWIGTGPYYLESADHNLGTLTLQRFPDHPDPDDRWADYAELPIPNVQVIGPDRIELGGEAVFDIFITLPSGAPSGQSQLLDVGLRSGQPYPSKDIERVDYLLVGGNTVYLNGQAVYVDEGHYRVVVDKNTASSLPGGAIQLEVVVVSKRVALPSTISVAIDNQNHTIFLPLTLR